MRPHFLIWSLGPKTGYVDGICHQTDSMNIFYLDVKTGPNTYNSRFLPDMSLLTQAPNKKKLLFGVLGFRCLTGSALLDCHVLKGFGIYMIGILDS